MALKTMIENLNKARKAYDEQLESLGKECAAAIADFLAPKIPAGYSVQWTQYTPYFNDGEACVFSVNEPYLFRRREGEKEHRWAEEYEDSIDLHAKNYGKSYKYSHGYVAEAKPLLDGVSVEAFEALSDAWSDLPEDMLLKAFGDHTKVQINSDGKWSNDEYDHD